MRKHITYIQHIKIQWCHTRVIFMPKHLIWKMQQCAHILSLIMIFHSGNVYCSAVPTVHWKTRKYFTCVNNNLYQMNIQNIHQKRASDDGDNNIWFSYQFLHTSHPKVGFSHTTFTHTWYKSLCWNATDSLHMTWILSRYSMSSWLFWEGSWKLF